MPWVSRVNDDRYWYKFSATFLANYLFMSVAYLILTESATSLRGFTSITTLISDFVFISGMSAHPVWKVSLGLVFAIAPMNEIESYGGAEKPIVAAISDAGKG